MKCIAHLLCGRVPGGRGQRPLGLVFGCGGVVVGLHNQDSFSGLSCPLEPFAKGRESPVPEGRRGEEGGALGRARREGLQDAGPMRGLPEGAQRVRICRSIRRLARHDAGQGIHPARSNPPPVQGLGSLRLRRVKPENDWRTDNGFPTTAQRQASSTLCLTLH